LITIILLFGGCGDDSLTVTEEIIPNPDIQIIQVSGTVLENQIFIFSDGIGSVTPNPISEAVVRVYQGTLAIHETSTDAQGQYEFEVPVNPKEDLNYTLEIQKDEFISSIEPLDKINQNHKLTYVLKNDLEDVDQHTVTNNNVIVSGMMDHNDYYYIRAQWDSGIVKRSVGTGSVGPFELVVPRNTPITFIIQNVLGCEDWRICRDGIVLFRAGHTVMRC